MTPLARLIAFLRGAHDVRLEASEPVHPAGHQVVRSAAGGVSLPVTLVPGDSAPTIEGSEAYHTTPSGKTVVRYPSAYKWRTVYHPSTRTVVVGIDWVTEITRLALRAA